MFYRRDKNVSIFDDTMELIEENKALMKALKYSRDNQKLYKEGDDIEYSDRVVRNSSATTVVSKCRSFEAASKYAKAGKKVAVLNFASSTNPGGGVVNGASAQEECLCRCSTLYPCLDIEVMWKEFYIPHRKKNDPLYNDDIIYTPDIVVCKSDISFPERMDEKDWYKVDVITCAAPNLRDVPSNYMNPHAGDKAADISDDELYKLHVKRISRIFQAAVAGGVDVIILGAFGCGAFMNSPEVVAKAFKKVQSEYEQYFETIEYAVFCGGSETPNYIAFCNEFGMAREYDLSRYHEAHNDKYETALREVTSGHKQSHWMWYIFPQIAGLGYSRTSKFYAISDLSEAKAYMEDKILGAHMLELCERLLALKENDPARIFDYPDDMKLQSSMTLFELAVPEQEIFGKVLDKFYSGKRDRKTIELVRK